MISVVLYFSVVKIGACLSMEILQAIDSGFGN